MRAYRAQVFLVAAATVQARTHGVGDALGNAPLAAPLAAGLEVVS